MKQKAIVWYGQISKGIANILKYAKAGIKVFEEIETRSKCKQLSLKL